MKLWTSETQDEREQYARVIRDWHRWFAWHPVEVGGEWRWLETLDRRYLYSWGEDHEFDAFEYRRAAP